MLQLAILLCWTLVNSQYCQWNPEGGGSCSDWVSASEQDCIAAGQTWDVSPTCDMSDELMTEYFVDILSCSQADTECTMSFIGDEASCLAVPDDNGQSLCQWTSFAPVDQGVASCYPASATSECDFDECLESFGVIMTAAIGCGFTAFGGEDQCNAVSLESEIAEITDAMAHCVDEPGGDCSDVEMLQEMDGFSCGEMVHFYNAVGVDCDTAIGGFSLAPLCCETCENYVATCQDVSSAVIDCPQVYNDITEDGLDCNSLISDAASALSSGSSSSMSSMIADVTIGDICCVTCGGTPGEMLTADAGKFAVSLVSFFLCVLLLA